MLSIIHQDDIEQMQQYLAENDDDFAKALAMVGYAQTRQRKNNIWALMAIIIDQQISKAAGASIQQKLLTRIGHDHDNTDDIDLQQIIALDIEGLRSCGLSRPKAGYMLGLCEAVGNGSFSLNAMRNLSDDEMVDYITRLKGFGRWSGEIYALFHCGRENIFPAGDLALQEATRVIKNLSERPSEKQLRAIAEQWHPYRGAAAIFLWHYYGKEIRA